MVVIIHEEAAESGIKQTQPQEMQTLILKPSLTQSHEILPLGFQIYQKKSGQNDALDSSKTKEKRVNATFRFCD